MMSIMLFTTLKIETNSRRCTVFYVGASKVNQKNICFCKMSEFCQFQRVLGVKTVYHRELIMKVKVVHNVVLVLKTSIEMTSILGVTHACSFCGDQIICSYLRIIQKNIDFNKINYCLKKKR